MKWVEEILALMQGLVLLILLLVLALALIISLAQIIVHFSGGYMYIPGWHTNWIY